MNKLPSLEDSFLPLTKASKHDIIRGEVNCKEVIDESGY